MPAHARRLVAPLPALLLLIASTTASTAAGPYTWYPRTDVACQVRSTTEVAVAWELPWYQGNPEGIQVASYLLIQHPITGPWVLSRWINWGPQSGYYLTGYRPYVDRIHSWYSWDEGYLDVGVTVVSQFTDPTTEYWVYNLIVWQDGTSAGYWPGPGTC